MDLVKVLADAIGRAAIDLPADVLRALGEARERESGPARSQLDAILENAALAHDRRVPVCQDTGTLTFFVELGEQFGHLPVLSAALPVAARAASARTPLRPNAVHPFSGANSADNTGRYVPSVTWEVVGGDEAVVHILPKGGGSENCSALAMLAPGVGLKGVKTAVVEHVAGCGGMPCPPTIVGIGIGGGADLAMKLAKKALLRDVGRPHPEPAVAALEAEIAELANETGVGPMGLGGRTTVLAVHVEWAHRHPASLPLGIVTQCWAHRRAAVRVRADGTAEEVGHG